MARRTLTTADMQARTFKRGEKVRLVADLPGIAVGSEGKVAMANGLTWNRYWVRLQDGRVIGHINHGDLVRSKHYDLYLTAREREAREALLAPAEKAEADMAVDKGSAGSATGEDAIVNGVAIPAYLLQRSADARIRLGA